MASRTMLRTDACTVSGLCAELLNIVRPCVRSGERAVSVLSASCCPEYPLFLWGFWFSDTTESATSCVHRASDRALREASCARFWGLMDALPARDALTHDVPKLFTRVSGLGITSVFSGSGTSPSTYRLGLALGFSGSSLIKP